MFHCFRSFPSAIKLFVSYVLLGNRSDIMNESRLKHLDDEEYSSRNVRHSLTACPLISQQSLLGEILSAFLRSPRYHVSAISMDATYNNSQNSSTIWRSFVMANLQICNIFAAEARLMNDPWSSATTCSATHNIAWKSRRGTIKVSWN